MSTAWRHNVWAWMTVKGVASSSIGSWTE